MHWKIKKIILEDLNPPSPITANTYFWKYGPSSEKVYEIFEQWLNQLSEFFNIPFKFSGNYIYYDNEKIGYFYYGKSRKHIYKKQNLKKIPNIIEKKIKAILPQIKELTKNGYDEVQALFIINAQSKTNDLNLLNFIDKNFFPSQIFLIKKFLEKNLKNEIDPSWFIKQIKALNQNQVEEIIDFFKSFDTEKIKKHITYILDPELSSTHIQLFKKLIEKNFEEEINTELLSNIKKINKNNLNTLIEALDKNVYIIPLIHLIQMNITSFDSGFNF